MTVQLLETTKPRKGKGKRRAPRDQRQVQRDILATLEALLPQFKQRCTAFYRENPRSAHPMAAYAWMHRELMSRFGPQAVLNIVGTISLRLRRAQQEVLDGTSNPTV